MKLYNVGILGATGAVGQEMMKILLERKFPVGELRPIASARSAGSETYWAHVLWQRHGLRPEEFDRMSRRQKLFYIASEEEESARPCRRDTMKFVPIRR